MNQVMFEGMSMFVAVPKSHYLTPEVERTKENDELIPKKC